MEPKEARKLLQPLLDRFRKYEHDNAFLRNEKQACQSLIVPFIRDILGWNTEDPSEFKPEYPSGGKRIDYVVSFKGISQFIVEAKAPNKDIFGNAEYYKQTLEYGYGKNHDFAILTNFRQIVVLGPRVEYRFPEGAELFRLDLTAMSDDELNEILCFERNYWLTKKEKNGLYKWLKGHKPQIPVDKRLLDDMKRWREKLLTNIKKNNPNLDFSDKREFRFTEDEVQKFIDRLIFMCYCEDKNLDETRLLELLAQKKDGQALNVGWLLNKIRDEFERYRQKYDSDLFDMSRADRFQIDDLSLVSILEDLRKPKDKPAYKFDSIEADILGKAYENFIGHIQKGEKRFKEHKDRGKRKKEGIYYTPKYVVDYIVNHTVREYVSGKKFDEILRVRILDPACGSGSFLIRAFDALLEESSKSLRRPLTYAEKKQLMLSCIYGVDVDERAVEIAKLNLSLQLANGHDPLPKLRHNIRNGNSIVDDSEVADYKAFVWEDEFEDFMNDGMFDIIIGNPPYIPIEMFTEKEKKHYFSRYKSPYRKFDSSILFIENSINLLKKGGLISFIVPQTWQTGNNYVKFRKYVLSNCAVERLVNLPFNVFEEAYIDTGIFKFKKGRSANAKFLAYTYAKKEKIISIDIEKYNIVEQSSVDKHPDNKVFADKFVYYILEHLGIKSVQLGSITDSCQGIVVSKFPISDTQKGSNFKKLLTKGVGRRYYFDIEETKFIDYTKAMHLFKYYSGPRMFVRRIINRQNRLMAFYYDEPLITKKDYNPFIITDVTYPIKYLLGLINSKLFSFAYLCSSSLALKDDFRQTTLVELRQLPIKKTSSSQMNEIAEMTDKISSLLGRYNKLKESDKSEKEKLEREINRIDSKMDEVVYRLYDVLEQKETIENFFRTL